MRLKIDTFAREVFLVKKQTPTPNAQLCSLQNSDRQSRPR